LNKALISLTFQYETLLQLMKLNYAIAPIFCPFTRNPGLDAVGAEF